MGAAVASDEQLEDAQPVLQNRAVGTEAGRWTRQDLPELEREWLVAGRAAAA